jgi:hypothetical protein
MKDYDFSTISAEVPPNAPPETILWLSVIDRAVLDYVKWYEALNIKQKRSLDWFLFETDPCPNNLAYLCDLLFDQHDAAEQIRNRAKHLASKDVSEKERMRYNLTRYRRTTNRLT